MKKIAIALGVTVFLLFVFFAGTGLFPFLEDSYMKDGRVHVHKPVLMPKNIPLLKKQTLVFFGYVGCADICTPRMHEIVTLVQQYAHESNRDDLDVLFINLDTMSTTKQADLFAKSFHQDFMGVTLPKNQLRRTTSMFNAYFSAGLRDKNEINHTQHLYLLHKDANQNFYLRNIYTKVPYDTKTILDDLIKEEE